MRLCIETPVLPLPQLEKSPINNLMMYLKVLEKQEQVKFKINGRN
jgi:hypothetical protein